jgi:hypothetical protein
LIQNKIINILISNNKFKITFADSTVKSIMIPEQNYSVSELALVIKNAINYSTFALAFNSDTYKYEF